MFFARPTTPSVSARPDGFAHIPAGDIYLDSACQSLRPRPVLDAMDAYYREYGACGDRVKYAWGAQVDEAVRRTRRAVLSLLALPDKHYAVSFTLNTTYGLNLLLQQLPRGQYDRVVTSELEHNSVFLSTMSAAQRLDVPRLVLARAEDGALVYDREQLQCAVVVVGAMSNIDGRPLANIQELVRDVHAAGGIVVIDAAQAMAHHRGLLEKTEADAVCFSAHKMYGASLGVVVARRTLLESLEVSFVGGGMVSAVQREGYALVPDEPGARLEPGLQAWAEIIGLGAAIEWLRAQPTGRVETVATQLYDGLADLDGVTIYGQRGSTVLSLQTGSLDAHTAALYLSHAGVMARSGYFCAHYYLQEVCGLPPLLRLSVGHHTTDEDITTTVASLRRIMEVN